MTQQNVRVMRILKLVNHDEQFELTKSKSGIDPVVINTFDLSDPDYMDKLSELVFSDGSGVDFVPKCQCGELQGHKQLGLMCKDCGTPVSKSTGLDDNNLFCRNWLSCPKQLPDGWLTPRVYLALSTWLTYGKGNKGSKTGQNYIDDILNVETPIPQGLVGIIDGKGFKYFHDNFDRIINYFIHDHPDFSKRPNALPMKYFLSLYRDQIWCHYIPILSSAVSPIVTNDGVGSNRKQYSDTTADHILKAAISLSRVHFSNKRTTLRTIERITFKAYKDIIEYFEDATSKYLSTKKAIPRAHIYGSRFHWSFRSVIVPITRPHRDDELHVPWRLAVNTFRDHILSKLCNTMGYSLEAAILKTRKAINLVDPEIEKILNDFIVESDRGLPCLWHRPPSIRDGNVMLKYITKVKTDLRDSTIGISQIDVAMSNADSTFK